MKYEIAKKISPWKNPTATDYNKLVDVINSGMNVRGSGAGVKTTRNVNGTVINIRSAAASATTAPKLWKVKSIRYGTFEGWYVAYRTQIDSDIDNGDPVQTYTGSGQKSDIVGCYGDLGYTTTPQLIPSDLMWGYTTKNTKGNSVNLAWPDPTRTTRLAKTEGAAATNAIVSVKLVEDDLDTTGIAFNCAVNFMNGGTSLSDSLPYIDAANKVVQVAKYGGVWYVVSPSFIEVSDCA